MTKTPKFKKSDFTVGQKVYSESVNNSFSNHETDGNIREEVIVSVGNKYVTTNVNKYSLETGEEVSNYGVHYVLHLDEEEAEQKVAKDKLYKRFVKEFEQKFGGLENQPLYKALTLEDLQKIAGIIDRRLWLEEGESDKDQLEQNLAKLWESIFVLGDEDNDFIVNKEMELQDGTTLRFVMDIDGYKFEVFRGDTLLCDFEVYDLSDRDDTEGHFGFECNASTFSGELKEAILRINKAFNFEGVVKEISEKGWLNKFGLYTTTVLKNIEEHKK